MIMPTLHRSVIIGRNPIEANANTGAIQLLGNPSAPPGNPLAIIGKQGGEYQKIFRQSVSA
jgi:hypothetical protein